MMSVEHFCEEYDVQPNNVFVQRHHGRLAESLFYVPKTGRKILIDHKQVLRRKDFQTKTIQENQQLFHYLLETKSANKISTIIGTRYHQPISSLNNFLSRYLFSCNEYDSVIAFRLSKNHQVMNKYYRYLLRQERKTNPHFTFQGD